MYDKYIDEFVPSKEMAEYLKSNPKWVANIADVIYYSPSLLERKYDALKELKPEVQGSGDERLISDCDSFIEEIEIAHKLRDAEGVFTVEPVDFDPETTKSEDYFDGVYANFADVMDFIKENLDIDEIKDQEIRWYELTKWVKDDKGKYVSACTYVVAHDKLIAVDVDDDFHDSYIGSYGADDINLPVPFKAGDIVEVDGYPYTPKKHLLIMEVGDNWDCCCLQGLFQEADGSWKTAAVKHNWIGFEAFPQISPLYTMSTYTGPLEGDEIFLKEVSDWIAGDEERAKLLWDKFFCSTGEKLDDVRAYMKSIG